MNILGIIAAVVGLGTSLYLYTQRKNKKKLMCPRKGGCEKVVSSAYGTFLGVHNDVLGAIYFASVLILIPLGAIDVWVLFLLKIAALSGFLYSMYLLLVQIGIVRAWCMWCTLSALMATLIFVSVF